MSDMDRTRQIILEALREIVEPVSGRDVVSCGFVRNVTLCNGVAGVAYELPAQAAGAESQQSLREQTKAVLTGLEDVREVTVEFRVAEQRATNALAGVRHVLAVGAGKGGVGKSTVAMLVAVGLKRMGLRSALLDADVYGPSLPKITGTEGAAPEVDEHGRVVPPEFEGIKIISMGHIIPVDQAVIWRGPMAQKYVKEFLERGDWGELDYLIVDLPPGTGDIPLTLAQSIPLTGAVVVCTPQDVALTDAVRALRMYQKLGVEPLGFVENMSFYVCPHCGARDHLFGQGGAERTARELGVPFLGGIPLNIRIREFGDEGRPSANFTETERSVAEAIEQVVQRLHEAVQQRARQGMPLPQLKVTG